MCMDTRRWRAQGQHGLGGRWQGQTERWGPKARLVDGDSKGEGRWRTGTPRYYEHQQGRNKITVGMRAGSGSPGTRTSWIGETRAAWGGDGEALRPCRKYLVGGWCAACWGWHVASLHHEAGAQVEAWGQRGAGVGGDGSGGPVWPLQPLGWRLKGCVCSDGIMLSLYLCSLFALEYPRANTLPGQNPETPERDSKGNAVLNK